MVAFFLGMLTLLKWQTLPALTTLIFLNIFLWLPYYWLPPFIKRYWRIAIIFLLGMTWACLCAQWRLQHNLISTVENKMISVQGYVASLPEQRQNNLRFEFVIQKLQLQQQLFSSPGRVRLTWEYPAPHLHVGEQWQLEIKLKRPHGYANPGSFDEEAWLLAHNIRATGYVLSQGNNHLIHVPQFSAPIARLRQYLAENIVNTLHGNELTGFITALTVGDRDAITAPQWQILKSTGTNHLMAIAGLHIGFIAAMIFFLVSFLWRYSGRLSLYVPTPQAAAFAALLAAIIYSALAGFALPTQRAVIMLAVFSIGVLWRRYLSPTRAFSIALLFILLLDPLSILLPSFWLSFSAVALIIYTMSGRINPHNLWWRWGRIQWILAVGFIPLTLIFFQQISLVNFIANFIAVPWVGFLVLPLCLLGTLLLLITPSIAHFVLQLAALTLQWLWWILTKLAALHDLQWSIAISNPLYLMSAIIGLIYLLAPRGMPARYLGLCGLLPLMFMSPKAIPYGAIDFTLLDVGQGLASVVRTQHHVLIYDTGAKFNADYDLGAAVVVPYLRTQQIKQIDRMVISHGDNDHIGGAHSILTAIPVTQIFTSVPQRFPTQHAMLCVAGQHWQWDGVQFQFIYPPLTLDNLDNDSSCVLRISAGNQSLLLTGDIERKSENYLLANAKNLLPATFLVAPHHGSATSGISDFIHAVMPQYVLFPVGYLNRYHFPNPAVVAKYQAINAQQFDTVHDGAIEFEFDANKILQLPSAYRQIEKRFWRNGMG